MSLEFCRLCKLSHYPELTTLKNQLALWDARKSPAETNEEFKNLKYQHFLAQRNLKELVHKIDNYESKLVQQEHLNHEVLNLKEQLKSENNNKVKNNERILQLQKTIQGIEKENYILLKKQKKFEPLETYLRSIVRLSLYTRTRMDYERRITRLTPEQISAINCVNTKGDYLIKGAAGTGKTIVLLEALKKEKKLAGNDKKIVLLTYTRTLVKYSQYLATILSDSDYKESISTADSYFLKILHLLQNRKEL